MCNRLCKNSTSNYAASQEKAQHLLFEHTTFGDLRSWFKGYFDTTSGQKKERASYETIAQAMGHAPSEILFLSDVTAELDAAREAGLSTAWLVRDPSNETSDHDRFEDFASIPLDLPSN